MNRYSYCKFIEYRNAVLIYPFVDKNSKVIRDFSIYNNHGLNINVSLSKGVAMFNGYNSYINIGKKLNDMLYNTTIITRIYIKDYPLKDGYGIFMYGYGQNNHGFRVRVDHSKYIWVLIAYNSSYITFHSKKIIELYKWSFIGVSIKPKQRISIYTDNTKITHNISKDMSRPSGDSLIGSSWDYKLELFKGKMKYILIYNIAIPHQKLKSIFYYINEYKNPKPKYKSKKAVYNIVNNISIELDGNMFKCHEII